MSQIQPDQTVGQLVAEQPNRARIFESLGIDYCCGGKRPLAAACAEKGLDTGTVIQALRDAESGTEVQTDWTTTPLGELADHIVATHHAYLREELPRLAFLTDKVANAHGERHPEMKTIRDLFAAFKAELEMHVVKEEAVLFPMCRQMEVNRAVPRFHCGGTIQNPIQRMEQEHQDAGDALEQMRALTHDFTPPADACNTFRVLMDSLARLEADMHQHVHKENNILFPRAIALEASLPPSAPQLEIAVEPAGLQCEGKA